MLHITANHFCCALGGKKVIECLHWNCLYEIYNDDVHDMIVAMTI